MTKYTFFVNKVERWKKDMATLWGNFDVCPHLHHLELPCHSLAELFSISSFKVWGTFMNPTTISPTYWSAQGIPLRIDTTAYPWYGWTPTKPGLPPWRRQLKHWLPAPPVEPIGLMPWHNCMRALTMHHSPRTNTWASYPSERQRKPPVGRSASLMSANSFLLAHKESIP